VFRDLGHMALAELHHHGGFQPQMATESGAPPRGGIAGPVIPRAASWSLAVLGKHLSFGGEGASAVLSQTRPASMR